MVLLNGKKLKYEEGKIWLLRETKTKPSYWFELKGSVDISNGYRRVKINYKTYLYHRVVYYLHNDGWKIHDSSMDNHIDHIDRDRLNNNIENLRVVTNQQNHFNTNAKGFSFHKAIGKYEARIMVSGEDNYLGLFVDEEDARQAYVEAKKIYHAM